MLGLISEKSLLNYGDIVFYPVLALFFRPSLPQFRALPPIKITYLESAGIGL